MSTDDKSPQFINEMPLSRVERFALNLCAMQNDGMPRSAVEEKMMHLLAGSQWSEDQHASLVDSILKRLLDEGSITQPTAGFLLLNPKKHSDIWKLNEQPRQGERLLLAAKKRLPELKKLLAEVSDHWGYEDPIYRYYHQSFKVYHVQESTQKIVEALQALAPHLKLNEDFLQIVQEGTGRKFEPSHNQDWPHNTRPMIEAFFHARHFLEMVCKYAEKLQEPPVPLPSGWASVLYLYNLR